MELKDFRRPPNDTGVCFHGTASNCQGSDVGLTTRLAGEAKQMGATWYKCLDPSFETTKALLAMGIEPVARMFVDRPGGRAYQDSDCQDARGKQKEFIRGGGKYVEAYWNEVNNSNEWQGDAVQHPHKIAEQWVPWVKETVAAGGWPSTPSLSQGGVWEDLAYLETFLLEVEKIDASVLQLPIWAGVHAYCLNHPPSYKETTGYDAGRFLYPDWRSSFLGYQLVAETVFRHTKREVPVILTEGGVVVGACDDPGYPRVSEELHRDWCVEMVEYMRTAPKYLFGGIGFWLISNEEAGFFDGAWTSAAFLRLPPQMYLPAVPALKALPRVDRSKVWAGLPPVEPPEEGNVNEQLMAELKKFVDSDMVQANPSLALAWLQAGGLTNDVIGGYRAFLLGQGQIPVTSEALDGIASLANSRIAELVAIAKKA